MQDYHFSNNVFPPKNILNKDMMQDYQKQCAQMQQIQLGICKSVNCITGLLEHNSKQSEDNEHKRKKRCKQEQETESSHHHSE